MSKIKNFGFLAVLLIAILVTFGITKNYSGQSCDQKEKPKIPHYSPPQKANISYRLSTNVVPLNYDLKIQPYMRPDQFYFNGTVQILVNCRESTDVIELNAKALEIPEKEIKVSGTNESENFKISKVTIENEVLKIKLNEHLKKNENYTVFIPFKGNLTTLLVGFYRSSYLNPKTNQTDYLAMTHFESTDARRAFPCYDEPALKATYDIEIVHWKNFSAIANMPNVSRSDIDSDWVKTKFERTVKMSTYLVAFAVGDFEFIENNDSKTLVRIVTRPSKKESGRIAAEVTPKILTHYENYFKVPFPLPKIDMLAAPDFEAGAMENWGLITYREAYVLFDKQVDTVSQLYNVISVIAHELAHQWSGNLVTMKWWDDLWLNEGFATYISYEGSQIIKPEFKVWEIFVVDELHDVLGLDSLKSSHPISAKVNDPNEIRELFDRISYAKGASIIRMMTYIIGEETFKQGMHSYLSTFKYSNAQQDDLWAHLQKANDANNKGTKLNVKEIMDSWTLKEGYPLITVTRELNTNKISFSQRRFLLNSNDTKQLMAEQYEVPITFTTKSEQDWKPKTKLWLHKTKEGESRNTTDENLTEDDWIIVNLQQTGYYRVTYDEHNWKLLIDQLHSDHNEIHLINRVQILDDLFSLAEDGVVKYSTALDALKYLKKEQAPLPWMSVGGLIGHINRMLRREDNYGIWQRFIRNLIENTYKSLDLYSTSSDTELQESSKKINVVSLACAYNLKSCVKTSKKLFNEFMDNNNSTSIPPEIRSTVYCTAVYHGDEAEWNFLYDRYLTNQNANERNRIITALSCSRVPWILNRYLRRIFDENSGFKRQDTIRAFQNVARQNYGKDIAFNFLRQNWNLIHSIFGTQMSFSRMIGSFDSLNTEFELNVFQEFYRSVGTKLGTAKRGFLQTIDKIKLNIAWMQKYQSEIDQYLKNEK